MNKAMMDQLLKAGVVDKKKANRARQEQHRRRKQGEADTTTQEAREAAEQRRQQQQERDRELNRQQQQARQQQADQARIGQWIAEHKVDRRRADEAFHFSHAGVITSLLVTAEQRRDLSAERLAVVQSDTGFELLPGAIAQKIAAVDESRVVVLEQQTLSEEEAQAYADYPVPDDLVW
ncbi:MAG: DUF2058 family protein [Wenzhouxiangellaceae bacterium]